MTGLTRRAVLAWAAGAGLVALSGCVPEPLIPSLRGRGEATHTPSPAASASPSPTLPAPPDPEAVAARFHGAVPTAWGTDLPGIQSQLAAPLSASGAPRIALTFDACGGRGGSGVDEALLAGLRAAAIPATLFLNSRWIEANPDRAADLAADPLFVLGNHGTAHVPLSVTGAAAYGISGTRSAEEAVAEVWGNHQVLSELTGSPPRYFRAGTAHYDDVGVQILAALGEIPIGFSVNGDGGATYSASTIRAEMARADAGGIVLAHMNQPRGATHEGALDAAAALRSRGAELVHLDL